MADHSSEPAVVAVAAAIGVDGETTPTASGVGVACIPQSNSATTLAVGASLHGGRAHDGPTLAPTAAASGGSASVTGVGGPHSAAAVDGTDGNDGSSSSAAPPLSKNALKRLKRDQKWDSEIGERRDKRKAKRERDKDIKRAKKEAGEPIEPKYRPGRGGGRNGVQEKSAQRVAIDLGFDEYHQDKDIKKLMKQVQTSYAANRRAKKALVYHLTSMQGLCLQRHEAVDGDKWDCEVSEKSYHETFAKDDIVYLSSESENVLDQLDDTKVYIIGGLVDHNRFKGLTHRLAVEQGVQHARLPILENFKLESRTVLTVNHVFEILLHFLNGNDWSAAIRSVIPERKGLKELHGEEGGAAQEERGAGSERAVADDKGATVQDAPS